MHSSGSFLKSVIEKIRINTDEPEVTSKYTDDILVRQFIADAWAETLGMLKLSADHLPLISFTFSLVQNQARYVIPAVLDSVVRLVQKDAASGFITADWRPRGDLHPWQAGWRIEGNEIVFDPVPSVSSNSWIILGVPSGDTNLHYGTGTVVSTTQVQLASTPDIGLRDLRPNAYIGMTLRVLSAMRQWQERTITAYDVDTRTVTVGSAMTQSGTALPDNGQSVVYEIAPLGMRQLWSAVAWKTSMSVMTGRDASQKRLVQFELQYQRALKSLMDRAKMQRRVIQHYNRNTVDNTALFGFDVWSFNE